jgi:heat shock protein HtpX
MGWRDPAGNLVKEGTNVNRVKTWVLIAALGGLFVLIGGFIGGSNGAAVALVIALLFNFAMYWYSDKIAIATTRSKPVAEAEYPELYRIVRGLTQERGLPMPRIYVSDMMQPNAFATGRNPSHAAVSVTKGILQILDERELRGVLAHEISHVANRDILIGSVAAAIAMSITFLARFAFFFGGSRDERNNPLGPFALIIAWVLAPIAAALIQMAVSRSREYQADESGARLSRDPDALASALRKIEAAARQVPAPQSVTPAQAHMFIVNPFTGRRVQFANLFSTHPPTEARIERLQEIKQRI